MKILIICSVLVGSFCYLANTYHLPPPQPPKVNAVTLPPQDTVMIKLSRAVAKIESRGNAKARRFEPRVFTRLTGELASTFDEAKRINWRAAMLSTSCGRYQILGTNYRRAGFKRIEDMFHASPEMQDSAFARFVRSNGYDKYIRRGEYDRFARAYNGAGYRRNNYHTKLMAEMR